MPKFVFIFVFVYDLFNERPEAVTMRSQGKGMWKEAVVVHFQALQRHPPNATAENHKKACTDSQFRGYLNPQTPGYEKGAVPVQPVRSVHAVRY